MRRPITTHQNEAALSETLANAGIALREAARAAAGAAGRCTLTRGRHSEPISVVELTPAEAAPVLKGAFASFPSFIKAYFDVTPVSPLAAFEQEAPRHPIFRVVSRQS
jgi:hypothetical protein